MKFPDCIIIMYLKIIIIVTIIKIVICTLKIKYLTHLFYIITMGNSTILPNMVLTISNLNKLFSQKYSFY